MHFPVSILSEIGQDVALTVGREDLLTLIALGTVVGQGTFTKIKNLRLNRPVESTDLRVKLRGNRVGAEDNKTTYLVSRTQTHHPARSAAYSLSARMGLGA